MTVTAQPSPYATGGYAPAPYPAPTYQVRREVPYDDGMTVPPGAVVVERSRRALWITGLTLFFSFYGLSVLVAASVNDSEVTPLWVPLVGPWLTWAKLDSDADAGGRFVLALDGIGQAAGALLFVLGLTVTRRYVVYGADNDHAEGRRVAVLPYVNHDGGGLSLTVF